MVINRYNRPKLPRNKYGYSSATSGTGWHNITIGNNSGTAIDPEILEYITALKNVCSVSSGNIKFTGNVLATGDVTALST